MARKTLIHKHTNLTTTTGGVLSPKLPTVGTLEKGEIAVNYKNGYETLSIENDAGEVIPFASLEQTMAYTDASVVNADWNATSGKAEILNKPDIPDERLSSSYQTSTLENDNLLLAGGDTYETAFSKMEKAILDNEETIAASLNDLNTRKIEIDDIPTKTSELINDSGYITSFTESDPTVPSHVKSITQQDITNWNNKLSSAPVISVNGETGAVNLAIPSASTTTPNMDGTAAVGVATTYARADHRHPHDDSKISYNTPILVNNTFAKNNKFYSNKTENVLYAADKRWVVTHKLFDSEGNFIKNLRTDLFNGDYDQGYNKDVLEGTYAELYIGVTDEESIESVTTWFMTYCSGELIASFYYKSIPSYMTAKVYWARTNPGWHDCSPEPYDDITDTVSGAIYKIPVSGNHFGAIKITYGGITQSDGFGTGLGQVEWKQVRVPVKLQSAVTKYPVPQDLYGEVTAPKFIKRGGTSSQFLKADGSVDSNTYLTSHQLLKTINNESLIGSGNITIQGGSGGGDTNIIETVKVNGTALTPDANKAVDITVPTAVTESTVSGWGFTKNTGTYSKPNGGIPKNDLTNDVQTSLGKADTALQSFTESDPTVPSHVKEITTTDINNWNNKLSSAPVTSVNGQTGAVNLTIPAAVTESTVSGWGFTKNAGTITGITMNGSSKGTSGVVNLGTVLTSHQTLKTINNESIVGSGNLTVSGLPTVTASDNGKVLQVVNGAWSLVMPTAIYSGTSTPNNSVGNDGDLYLQTS